MTSVLVAVEDVPPEATCVHCGHRNGELVYSEANGVRIGEGVPFSQAMYRVNGRWVHEGCEWDRAWDSYREARCP